MFQVGDIVKYISEIREGPDWIGYVINIDHNGYTKYLKVIFSTIADNIPFVVLNLC